MNQLRPLAVLPLLVAVALAGEELEVTPGTVVRWSGTGTSACALGERTWAPLGDTCYFPVDLLASGRIVCTRIRHGQAERRIVRVGRYPYPEQRLTVPDNMVHLSPEDLARVERENARISQLWFRESEPHFSLPLSPPLPPQCVGRGFGSRRVFNGQPRNPHNGIDFRAPEGTAVRTVAEGLVVLAENHFFAGNAVYVDHGGGLISMYFHLADLSVHEGQHLERGEVLGHVGNTGRAIRPHLHFGLRWHGARIDPNLLFAPPEHLPALAP